MRYPLTPARNLGARVELFPALRADVTDYGRPGVHLGPPRARKKGSALAPAGEPEAPTGPPIPPAVPIVRLWSFAVQQTSPGDAIASSPLFNGPALVHTLAIQYDDDNTTPRPTITLWYGESQPANAAPDPSSVVQLGTPLFETPALVNVTANSWQTPVQHLPKWHGAAGSDPTIYELRYPIRLPRFQVSVRMGTQTAGSHVISGYLRILEAESYEALALYL